MQRQRQHVVTLPVDMLGTIAVMHVPVEYRHFAQTVFLFSALDGDRDIGQKTKAHRLVRQAVVSRRA
ncbi:hypothetical protein D3C72_2504540 [compost metagenome]